MSGTLWIYALAVFAAIFACRLSKAVHASVAVFAAVNLFSALATMDTGSPHAAFTALTFVSLAGFFAALKPQHTRHLVTVGYYIFTFSIAATLMQFNLAPDLRHGISGNASMNGSLIALAWPFALKCIARGPMRYKDMRSGIYTALAFTTILMTGATIPLLMISAMVVSFAVSHRHAPWAWLAVAPLAAGYLIYGDVVLSDTGRYAHWRDVFNFYVSSGNWFFGMGAGTYQIIFGLLPSGMAQWAHNDFLQLLFETGAVGLASVIAVVFYALKGYGAKPWVVAGIAGYVVCACFGFPGHMPLHAFLGGSLVWISHKGLA